MTSARSADPRRSECWLTVPKLKVVGLRFQPMGCWGTTTGAGMKPPSVPIMIQSGPLVAGSGMPLGQSAYWFAGATLTGTIFTSVQTVGSAGVGLQGVLGVPGT
jgi:hypothetical protein